MKTTTQGLTSPHRHTRPVRFPHGEAALAILAALLLPLFEWLDDHTTPTTGARTISRLLAVVIALAVIGVLTGCKPADPTIPTITPATSTAPAPQPTTTWEQVGA